MKPGKIYLIINRITDNFICGYRDYSEAFNYINNLYKIDNGYLVKADDCDDKYTYFDVFYPEIDNWTRCKYYIEEVEIR